MIEVYEKVQPDYTIKQFGDTDIYTVTKFHRKRCVTNIVRSREVHDDKLAQSVSRARSMIKAYGLSNPWAYFCTLTLDKEKYNRYDLDAFRADLTQWVRDERKRYKKLYPNHTDALSFVLVPEMHQDGAWHLHGFLNGIPDAELAHFVPGLHPAKLVEGGYLNWSRYQKKFGFCSLGRIRDKTAATFYILKYISKSMESVTDKGRHLYFASRPLMGKVHCADAYGSQPELDGLLQHEFKFCSTGMVKGKPWWWAAQFDDDISPLYVDTSSDQYALPDEVDDFTLFEQLSLFGVLR